MNNGAGRKRGDFHAGAPRSRNIFAPDDQPLKAPTSFFLFNDGHLVNTRPYRVHSGSPPRLDEKSRPQTRVINPGAVGARTPLMLHANPLMKLVFGDVVAGDVWGPLQLTLRNDESPLLVFIRINGRAEPSRAAPRRVIDVRERKNTLFSTSDLWNAFFFSGKLRATRVLFLTESGNGVIAIDAGSKVF